MILFCKNLSSSCFTDWIQFAFDGKGIVMLKLHETINGTLLLFSVSVTAKHYATCEHLHSSHLIDRYIVTWFDKQLVLMNPHSFLIAL